MIITIFIQSIYSFTTTGYHQSTHHRESQYNSHYYNQGGINGYNNVRGQGRRSSNGYSHYNSYGQVNQPYYNSYNPYALDQVYGQGGLYSRIYGPCYTPGTTNYAGAGVYGCGNYGHYGIGYGNRYNNQYGIGYGNKYYSNNQYGYGNGYYSNNQYSRAALDQVYGQGGLYSRIYGPCYTSGTYNYAGAGSYGCGNYGLYGNQIKHYYVGYPVNYNTCYGVGNQFNGHYHSRSSNEFHSSQSYGYNY